MVLSHRQSENHKCREGSKESQLLQPLLSDKESTYQRYVMLGEMRSQSVALSLSCRISKFAGPEL